MEPRAGRQPRTRVDEPVVASPANATSPKAVPDEPARREKVARAFRGRARCRSRGETAEAGRGWPAASWPRCDLPADKEDRLYGDPRRRAAFDQCLMVQEGGVTRRRCVTGVISQASGDHDRQPRKAPATGCSGHRIRRLRRSRAAAERPCRGEPGRLVRQDVVEGVPKIVMGDVFVEPRVVEPALVPEGPVAVERRYGTCTSHREPSATDWPSSTSTERVAIVDCLPFDHLSEASLQNREAKGAGHSKLIARSCTPRASYSRWSAVMHFRTPSRWDTGWTKRSGPALRSANDDKP